MSLTDRIAALTPEQRALFEKLRENQRQAARAHQPPPVRRVSGPDGAGDWPLSLDQERYWFMEQLRPGGAGLNIGTADPHARARSPCRPWRRRSARSSAVTRPGAPPFPILDGGPVQRVAASRRQRLAVDRSLGPAGGAAGGGGPAPGRRGRRRAVRPRARSAGADEPGPRQPAGPRLPVDGAPSDRRLHSPSRSSGASWPRSTPPSSAGGPPLLPEPPVHYPDFAVWQREWLPGRGAGRIWSPGGGSGWRASPWRSTCRPTGRAPR